MRAPAVSIASSLSSSSSSSSSCRSEDVEMFDSDEGVRRRKRTWDETESESDDDASDSRKYKQLRKGFVHSKEFARVVAIAVDGKEALSTRMENAISMWQHLNAVDSNVVSGIIEEKPLLMFKLVDALLSTAYFPLQQFYFMTLSGLLYLLNRSREASAVAALQSFINSIQHFDSSVSKLLPLYESVDWSDPKIARKHVNELNKCTHVCKTFKVVKCWISEEGASNLRRVKIDSWVDIGGGTLSFYRKHDSETSVINVPSGCIEKIDRDEQNSLVYIYTKSSFRADGASLFVFEPSPVDFDALSSTLSELCLLEPSVAYEELKRLIPDQLFDHNSQEQHHENSERIRQCDFHAVLSDDETQTEHLTEHLTSDLLRFLEDSIDERSRRVQDESNSVHTTLVDHFNNASASLTVAFSNISGSHISWDHELSRREFSIQSSCDALQQQRFLSLPHSEHEAEKALLEFRQECNTRYEDSLGYAKESIEATVEDESRVFRIVILITVSVIIVPWTLFVGLYLFNVLVMMPEWLQAAVALLM